MNFLSSKMELSKTIKEQKNQIEELETEKASLLGRIEELSEEVVKNKKKSEEYENKYVRTNLECGFCFNTLQKEFMYCPKCGKRIEKLENTNERKVPTDIFQTENDGSCLLINQYNGFNDKKITIPSSINGKPVIGIWNNVFEKCTELEEVVIEEGCKYIGKNVFARCEKLKKVRLPKSLLEIGDGAFLGCTSLEEIAIPPNVNIIGTYAFSGCRNLNKIVLPDQLSCISSGMLSNTGIKEIDIPQSVIHIGPSAFANTKLVKVVLPNNLYSIECSAFDIDSLREITIHSNVEIIEAGIFGRSASPIIYCAAGSKALLYARKYGMKCVEIPLQKAANVQIGSTGIILVLGSLKKTDSLSDWYRRIGVSKAATWSWEVKYWNQLEISKNMNISDAYQLKNALQNYISRHSDWSRPDAICSLQELSVCQHWGNSCV